ncbi:hypothetical protein VU677_11500 [Hafnia paralvei]|uniref:hypothetical protein n=1 Tax=Hafnia paralvei TaxID=546367 RepID=UPI00300C6F76
MNNKNVYEEKRWVEWHGDLLFCKYLLFIFPLSSLNNKCQSQLAINNYGKLLKQITLNIYLLNQG